LVTLSSVEMTRGPMVMDVSSEWFGRPQYYRINAALAAGEKMPSGTVSMVDIHPSRVVEFIGAELPTLDLQMAGGMQWGDSVLQIVDEALKDFGGITSSIAAMVNDAKVDVFMIPGLTKSIADKDYETRLTKRIGLSNQMKSTINAMLMDEKEEWKRTQTSFSALPDLVLKFLMIACGAAHIPMSRLVGHGPGSGANGSLGSGASGGESDMRSYYDDVMSQQKNDYGPRMSVLDQVLIRSALGLADDKIYYAWSPLYKPDPAEEAAIALEKAQTFQIDVTAGLINPDVLRTIRINQLTEDATYPGIEAAVDEHGAEPEEPEVTPEDVQAHLQTLQKSSAQLQQIGKQATPLLPAPKKPQTTDGASLAGMLKSARRKM
jgi:phage-related protein (TIGR01555 family)